MTRTLALAAAMLLSLSTVTSAQIVNIDSRHGFNYDGGGSNPAPVPGQHVNIFGEPPVQLTLNAGTYRITNAFGKPGALYNAWSYNTGTSSWAWAFLMVNDATGNVIQYYEGGFGSSAAEVAALPGVQNFSALFTLLTTTTIDFTLRDYFVDDNAGGISIDVTRMDSNVVPEPASVSLLAGGLLLTVVTLRRRRHTAT